MADDKKDLKQGTDQERPRRSRAEAPRQGHAACQRGRRFAPGKRGPGPRKGQRPETGKDGRGRPRR